MFAQNNKILQSWLGVIIRVIFLLRGHIFLYKLCAKLLP